MKSKSDNEGDKVYVDRVVEEGNGVDIRTVVSVDDGEVHWGENPLFKKDGVLPQSSKLDTEEVFGNEVGQVREQELVLSDVPLHNGPSISIEALRQKC
ncbi:hypothetical protein V6N13_043286 [Hibiscus sabdariffa]|uniref:Uncharacterized protein n=1 Tax=Hibiscus sabdariffa TaxID=183260 RepID=A0ABR2G213_9ROSI